MKNFLLTTLFAALTLLFSHTGHAGPTIHQLPASQLPALKATGGAQYLDDIDNIAVIEYSGNYDRSVGLDFNLTPRTEVSREFLAHHSDDYDFLLVFSTFAFETGDADAFYVSVFNDTQGIGLEPFDSRAAFGSAKRLQGYIDMSSIDTLSLNPWEAGYDGTLGLMLHEVMHRWGAYVRFDNGAGISGLLSGADDSHWSQFVDTDASLMYGADWVDNGDGSFTAQRTRHQYSPLDLYLAGFLPPNLVPGSFVIDGADGDPLATDTLPGTTVVGTKTGFAIEHVIAAEGVRSPAYSESQRDFRVGFVLLTRPGEVVDSTKLAGLELLRDQFADRFSIATRGMGSLRTDLGATAIGPVNDPQVINPSSPANGVGDLELATQWLLSNQESGGYWEDKPATRLRDTAAALLALEVLAAGQSEYAAGQAWLKQQLAENIDELAWQIVASDQTDLTTALNALASAQNADGGWGLEVELRSSPRDTALVLSHLLESGYTVDSSLVESARNYLRATEADGWGAVAGGTGDVTTSAMAIIANAANSTSEAKLWLANQSQPSFGSSHETAWAIKALGSDQPEAVNDAVGFLAAQQSSQGDWENSVYSTALASVVLNNQNQANLVVASPRLSNPSPQVNEQIVVRVDIRNSGLVDAEANLVRLYSGDPAINSDSLIAEQAIAGLVAGAQQTIEFNWTATEVGVADLFVVVDPDDTQIESNEVDNKLAIPIVIAEPSNEPELVFDAASLSYTPTSLNTIPTTLEVVVDARNLGLTAVDNVVVQLLGSTSFGEQELATETVSLPAESRVAIAFDALINDPDLLNFRIVLDVTDVAVEDNENNNELTFSLDPNLTVDLRVVAENQAIQPASPAVGEATIVLIEVGNQGTQATSANLIVELLTSSAVTTLLEQTISLSPGQLERRELNWTPTVAGAYELIVELDRGDSVVESDESNNRAAVIFSVGGSAAPNLSVDPMSITFDPSPALQGQPFNLTAEINNHSDLSASQFIVSLLDAPDGQVLADQAIATLDGNTSQSVQLGVSALQVAGRQTFVVQVDSQNQVVETDELDNLAVTELFVQSLPDLEVTSASFNLVPSIPAPGQAATVEIAVVNRGDQMSGVTQVALLERFQSGDDREVGTQPLSALAGQVGTSVTFDWIVSSDRPLSSLVTRVDPNGTIVESNESNNLATRIVDAQNGDFFATNPYFSPNGDGIKDTTELVFSVASPVARIELVGKNGRIAKTFNDGYLANASVSWDGLGDDGLLVWDGDYNATAIDRSDSVISRLVVTVDTNNTTAYAAFDSNRLVKHDLTCAYPGVSFSLAQWSADGKFLYSSSFDGQARGQIYRFEPRGGNQAELLTSAARDLLNNARVSINSVLSDGRILFSSDNALWVLDAPFTIPRRLLTDNAYAGHNDESVFGFSFGFPKELTRKSIDGSVAAVNLGTISDSPPIEAVVGGVVAAATDGIDDQRVFIPNDGGPRVTLDSWSDDEFFGINTVSADGRFWSSVVASYPGPQASPMTSLRIIDLESPATPIIEQSLDSVIGAFGNITEAVTIYFSPQNLTLVFDQASAIATIYDQQGRQVEQYEFDTAVLDDAATGAGFLSYVYTSDLVWSPNANQFVVSIGIERTDFDINEKRLSSGSPKTAEKSVPSNVRSVFQVERVPNSVELIGQFGLEGAPTPSGISQWVAGSDSVLRRGNPLSLLHLRPDVSVTDIELLPNSTRQWPTDPGAITKQFLARFSGFVSPCDTFTGRITAESADNLIAYLRLTNTTGAIQVEGIATDQNLQSYQLDWARSEAPESWFVLAPPSGIEIVNDLMTSWAPTEPGTYLVRLTVKDRAGNQDTDIRSISWFESSPLSGVSVSDRYLSPNGDGNKEQVTLAFTVEQPINLTATVETTTGNLVRTFSASYDQVGTQSGFVWDGINDAGSTVADGDYQINVLGLSFPVTVDASDPVLSIEVPPMRRFVPATDSEVAHFRSKREVVVSSRDENFASGRIEASYDGQSWFEISRLNEAAAVRSVEVSPDEFALASFRVSATDLAGNSSTIGPVRNLVPDALIEQLHQNYLCGLKIYRQSVFLPANESVANVFLADAVADSFSFNIESSLATDLDNTVTIEYRAVGDPWSQLQVVAEGERVRQVTVPYESIGLVIEELLIDGSLSNFYDIAPGQVYEFRVVASPAPGEAVLVDEFKVSWNGLSDCPFGPGVDDGGSPPTQATLQVESSVGSACIGTGGNILTKLMFGGPSFGAQATVQPQLPDVDVLFGGEIIGSVQQPALGVEYVFGNNVSGLPVGSYPVSLQFREGTGDVVYSSAPPSANVNFSLGDLLSEPEIELEETVCLTGRRFPVPGSVDGQARVANIFHLGLGHNAASDFHTSGCTPPLWANNRADVCSQPLPLIGELGKAELAPENQDYSGPATLIVESISSRGVSACTTKNITIDSNVEVGFSPQDNLLSPNGDGFFETLTIDLVPLEPVTLQLSLPGLIDVVDEAELEATPTAYVFDGRATDGSILPDGNYVLRFVFIDGCGHELTETHVVRIDTTAPVIELSEPLSGATLTTASVELMGGITDPLLKSATLSVRQSGGAWLDIDLQSTNGILANWQIGSLLRGNYEIRIQAEDQAANQSELIIPVVLGDAPDLVAGLAVDPPLFSPNGDGVKDATQVVASMLQGASATLEVVDSTGGPVRSLLVDSPLGSGSQFFTWDGLDDGGQPVADGNYVVRLSAQSGATGQVAEVTVVLDNTPPALTTTNPSWGFIKGEGDFEFVVDELHIDRVEALYAGLDPPSPGSIIVDTLSAGAFSVPSLTTLAEGRYRFDLQASDRAGNSSESRTEFNIDRTAPEVTLLTPVDGDVVGGADALLTVTGQIDDQNLERFALALREVGTETWQEIATDSLQAPSAVVDLAWPITVTDGEYELRLRGFDQAGNHGEQIATIVIDTTPPVAAISDPVDSDVIGRGYSIIGTATDDNFARFELSTSTAGPEPQWSLITAAEEPVSDELLWAWENLPVDGSHLLRLVVIDAAGLSSEQIVDISVDGQSPDAPINLVATQVGADVQLNWTASSAADLAGYRVFRNGALLNSAVVSTTTYVDADVPDGAYDYWVVAVDEAGNESRASNVAPISIDRTPPTVLIISPRAGEVIRGQYDFVGTANSAGDFAEYRLTLAGISGSEQLIQSPAPVVGQTMTTWDSSASSGQTFTLTLVAEDLTGNAATATVEFSVDNESPNTPIGLTALVQNTNDVALEWTPNGDSDLLGYLLYRDGTLIGAPSGTGADLRPFAISDTSYLDEAVADGTHTYRVVAIDLAGNVSETSNPAEITIESGPPSAQFELPTDGDQFEQSLYILAVSDDTDIASVAFEYASVLSGIWQPLHVSDAIRPYAANLDPVALDLEFGGYRLRATATDQSGLADPAPPVITVEYADLTAPDAPTALVAAVDGDTAALNWSASNPDDFAQYIVFRSTDDAEFVQVGVATESSYVDSPLADADYQYYVVSEDTAGNNSSESNHARALVDTPVFSHPYSPTLADSTEITATTKMTGSVTVDVTTAAGTSSLPSVTVSANGSFSISPLTLAVGSNTIELRVIDSQNNRSKPAQAVVVRSQLPSAPLSPSTSVDGVQVTFDWQPPAQGTIFGYRTYRDGEPTLIDAPLTSGLFYSASSNATLADRVATSAGEWFPADTDLANAPAPWLEVTLDETQLLTALNLRWYRVPTQYRVQGWSGDAWIDIATVTGGQLQETVELSQPYLTNRVRVIIDAADSTQFRPVRLNLLTLQARPLESGLQFLDTVADGQYDYSVAAINTAGFAGPQAGAVPTNVGDVDAPEPLVLSGQVTGSDALLTWDASSAVDIAQYRLFRDGDLTGLVTDTAILSYTDSALPNGSYDYVVFAVDASGNTSEPSNPVTLTIDVGALLPPRALAVTADPVGAALDLSWQAPESGVPAGYGVQRSEQAGGPYALVATTTGPSYRDTAVDNGVTYFYVITARDGVGNDSPPSNEAFGTPRDLQAPGQPVLTFPTVASQPISVQATNTDIAGLAEPNVDVAVLQDGVTIGTVRSGAEFAQASVQNFSEQLDSLGWARDGQIKVYSSYPAKLLDVATGETIPLDFDEVASAHWTANGQEVFVTAYDRPGELRVFNRTGVLVETTITAESIEFGIPSPDGSQVLIGARVEDAVTNTLRDGIWLLDRATGTMLPVADWTTSQLSAREISWSPTGDRLVALVTNTTVDLVQIDISDLTVQTLQVDVRRQGLSWDNTGDQAAFVARIDGVDQIMLVNTVSGSVTQVTSGSNSHRRPIWSPDDQQIAYRLACCELEIIDLTSGEFSDYPSDYVEYLQWSTSGQLLLASDSTLELVNVPGLFTLPNVALFAGENRFSAVAIDEADNRSLPAADILVELANTALPDLAVTAADISLVPNVIALGDPITATVFVRNNGSMPVTGARMLISLISPTESIALVDEQIDLVPGQLLARQLDLDTIIATGDHTIVVELDPANTIVELSETNNLASALLQVTNSAQPQLTVSLQSSAFAGGQPIVGTAEVVNPGSSFSGSVELQIVDQGGFNVGWNRTESIDTLAFADNYRFDFEWTAVDAFSGAYTLVARLLDLSQQEVDRTELPFTIEQLAQFDLQITAPTVVTVGDTPTLTTELSFLSGNAAVENARLEWQIALVGGAEVWFEQEPLPTMLPGFTAARSQPWPTEQSGEFELTVTLIGDGIEQSASSLTRVDPAAAVANVTGSLVLDSTTVVLGNGLDLMVALDNVGDVALVELPIVVQLMSAGSVTPLQEVSLVLDLDVGASVQQLAEFDASLFELDGYLLALRADLSAQGGSAALLLDSTNLTVVDGDAPIIDVLSPAVDSIQALPVAIRALVTDLSSAIDSVTVTVAGQSFAMGLGGVDGAYQKVLNQLADGPQVFTIEATDAWGNVSRSEPLSFVVDTISPEIVIEGVADGQLSNQALSAQISVTDLHLDSVQTTLDGGPYVSGTPIDTEGQHLLRVTATDAAGNQREQVLSFEIDLTAPALDVLSPVDGSITSESTVDVTGQTEAGAVVTITIGGSSLTVVADATGVFTVPGIELQLGTNLIEAYAMDAAGNQGVTEQLTVTYQDVSLSGVLTLPPELTFGSPLLVDFSVLNQAAVAADDVDVQIVVVDSAGLQLASDTRLISVAAGASFVDSVQFPTDGWVLGVVRVDLLINGEVSASSAVQIVDRDGPLVVIVAPSPNSFWSDSVSIQATANDVLSDIASVEFRSSSTAPWQALTMIAAPDVYGAQVTGLAEGDYQIEVRATDAVGNETIARPSPITIDLTPPVIQIVQPLDGSVSNQSVVVEFEVTDSHLDTTTASLNGAPIGSNAAVTAEGEYTLFVSGTDLAENSAEQSVQFTIDLTPPAISIDQPLADAVLTALATDLLGSTEPFSVVTLLQTGQQTTADANGNYQFVALALEPGSNTLTVAATDPAGNESDPLSVTVTVALPAQTLSGTLTAAPIEIMIGDPLVTAYTIAASCAVDACSPGLVDQAARVRVVDADGLDVATSSFNVDLSTVSMVAGEISLATGSWTLGTHLAMLDVWVDGDWLTLADFALDVVGEPPQTCQSLAFANDYNALIFGDFTSTGSDTQGRLAVQGTLSLNHYSVADRIDPSDAGLAMLVGGDINFPSGRIYYGSVLAGGSANLGDAVLNGLAPEQTVTDQAELPVDFAELYLQQRTLSDALSLLEPNGQVQHYSWGGFDLTGDGSSALQVFNVVGEDVLAANTFNLAGVPEGATVIVNLSGSNVGLSNMGLQSFVPHRSRVVFNFFEAEQLTLSGIGVEGNILAPDAVVEQPQGVIKGTIVAKSWNGQMQLNHDPFEGCALGETPAPIAIQGVVETIETEVVPGTPLTVNYDLSAICLFGNCAQSPTAVPIRITALLRDECNGSTCDATSGTQVGQQQRVVDLATLAATGQIAFDTADWATGQYRVVLEAMWPTQWRLIDSYDVANTAALVLSNTGVSSECRTLGGASTFNGVSFGDFVARTAATRGRLAIGGDAELDHYNIGRGLADGDRAASLTVGGDLRYPTGTVHQGSLTIGGNAVVGDGLRQKLQAHQTIATGAASSVDFPQLEQDMQALSRDLAELATTGTLNASGKIEATGDGISLLQVFRIDADALAAANNLMVKDVPSGATIVFNISGDSVALRQLNMRNLSQYRTRTVFNLHQASSLELAGTVQGSVLAPYAQVSTTLGTVNGTIVVASWDGRVQLQHHPFDGCLGPTTNSFTVLTGQRKQQSTAVRPTSAVGRRANTVITRQGR